MNTRAQTSAGQQRRRELSKTAKSYHPAPMPVKPVKPVKCCRQIFPGCRDRAPACPPAAEPRRAPADGTALGLLVLTLSARAGELPSEYARQGWGLAQRWLSELVDARLSGGAA